nr:MAG TPA: hypothetical protein [Bacteriophage sp.]
MVSISKPFIGIFFSAKNCTFYSRKVRKIALFSTCQHIFRMKSNSGSTFFLNINSNSYLWIDKIS